MPSASFRGRVAPKILGKSIKSLRYSCSGYTYGESKESKEDKGRPHFEMSVSNEIVICIKYNDELLWSMEVRFYIL